MAVGITKHSGLVDLRNARSRNSDGTYTYFPNNDYMYGPYEKTDEKTALQVAFEKLSEKNSNGADALVKGKTVGIVEDDGTMVEYWFESEPADPDTGYTIDDLVKKGGKSICSADETKKWLKVEGDDNKRYFIPMTELVTPNTPTIATKTVNVITGNGTFSVANQSSGATMYYAIKGTDGTYGSWVSLGSGTTGTITIASGFSNSSDNSDKVTTVKLKCTLNGEDSDESAEITLTIHPKVAKPTISVTRKPNDNNWATEASIVISPSATTGATNKYSTDGGKTWNDLTAAITISVTSTQAASLYQVKATKTDYADSDTAKSGTITLGAKKFYIGFGAATLANEDDIKALASQVSKEQSTMAGSYTTSRVAGSYLWICGAGTLTSVKSGGFAVPMEAVSTSITGYNCYRSKSAMAEAGSATYDIS